MGSLAERELIETWERGQPLDLVGRARTLLAAAHPRLSREELDELTLGARDLALLELHEQTLGSELDCFVECPSCGTPLEFRLDTRTLRASPAGAGAAATGTIRHGGRRYRYRALTCADLAAAAATANVPEARAVLAQRAVTAPDGVEELPPKLVEKIAARLAELDPYAEVRIALHCLDCEHAWQAPLDVGAFVWRELAVHARRLLEEIADLARAFGWREQDVLDLSPARRSAYLELAR